jgi:hypothetical protein
MDKPWKAFERKVAKLFGTVRIPVDGRGDRPDMETETHVVEMKHWKNMPYRVEAALMQAEKNSSPEKLPLAIIGQSNRRWQDSLVVMRLGEYIDHYSPKDDTKDE